MQVRLGNIEPFILRVDIAENETEKKPSTCKMNQFIHEPLLSLFFIFILNVIFCASPVNDPAACIFDLRKMIIIYFIDYRGLRTEDCEDYVWSQVDKRIYITILARHFFRRHCICCSFVFLILIFIVISMIHDTCNRFSSIEIWSKGRNRKILLKFQ